MRGARPATPLRATAAVPSARTPARTLAAASAVCGRTRLRVMRCDIFGAPPIQCSAVAAMSTAYSATERATYRGTWKPYAT